MSLCSGESLVLEQPLRDEEQAVAFVLRLAALIRAAVNPERRSTFLQNLVVALREHGGQQLLIRVFSRASDLEVSIIRGDDQEHEELGSLLLHGVNELELCLEASPLAALEGELVGQGLRLGNLRRELVDTNRGVTALVAELEEQAEKLRAGNEQKGRFLRKMGRELRKPLNAVLNLSWLLLNEIDGPLTSEQQRQVSAIRRAAAELHEMVDDIFDLTRLEAGSARLVVNDFAAIEVLRTLAYLARPMRRSRQVRLHFDREGGQLTVRSDETRVIRVLRHLLSNALKFTLEGDVRVGYGREADEVRFWVQDTGVGIDANDFERIFEELEDISDEPARRGAGLGLPLCRRLAQLLGGRIELESRLGEGSRFSLVLPMEPGRPAPAFDPERALARFGEESVLREAVTGYLDNHEQTLTRLEGAFEAGDLRELREAAHWLKGAVLYLQAESAGTAASELEACCRRGGDVESAYRNLVPELERLRQALDGWKSTS